MKVVVKSIKVEGDFGIVGVEFGTGNKRETRLIRLPFSKLTIDGLKERLKEEVRAVRQNQNRVDGISSLIGKEIDL